MSSMYFSIEDKKELQSNSNNKIRLVKKTLNNKKFSNLKIKCNKNEKDKCNTLELVKNSWTNVDRNNLDKIKLARHVISHDILADVV